MWEVKNKKASIKRHAHSVNGWSISSKEGYSIKRDGGEYREGSIQVKDFEIGWNSASVVVLGKSKVVCNEVKDFIDWDILRKPTKVKENSVEAEFYTAAKNWKKETSIYSFVSRKITNKHYVNIIGLGVVYGEPIVKVILKDLEKGNEFWHYALKKITNANPVAKGDVNNLHKVRKAWLAWGKENNLI